MTTLADRYDQFKAAATVRGVDDEIGDIPTLREAVIAYAAVLGVPTVLALNTDLPTDRLLELADRQPERT